MFLDIFLINNFLLNTLYGFTQYDEDGYPIENELWEENDEFEDNLYNDDEFEDKDLNPLENDDETEWE